MSRMGAQEKGGGGCEQAPTQTRRHTQRQRKRQDRGRDSDRGRHPPVAAKVPRGHGMHANAPLSGENFPFAGAGGEWKRQGERGGEGGRSREGSRGGRGGRGGGEGTGTHTHTHTHTHTQREMRQRFCHPTTHPGSNLTLSRMRTLSQDTSDLSQDTSDVPHTRPLLTITYMPSSQPLFECALGRLVRVCLAHGHAGPET